MVRNRGSALDSLFGMSREMDRLAGSIWPELESGSILAMPAEVVETDNEIRFEVEMPGFRNEDLDITLENNVLTIAGEKKMEREEERKESDYRLFERRYGRYQRSFTVPPTVRGDDCEAEYQDGVLTVRLPKTEEAKPRRIQVHAGSGKTGDGGRKIEARKS
ncbi:MAG: Hsp20/alpha crystallin family protein [Longimicrobiales bacterium]